MVDDTSKRGPRDAKRIDVNEPLELGYWTKELGCTADELCTAVNNVGVLADDVRRHLKAKK